MGQDAHFWTWESLQPQSPISTPNQNSTLKTTVSKPRSSCSLPQHPPPSKRRIGNLLPRRLNTHTSLLRRSHSSSWRFPTFLHHCRSIRCRRDVAAVTRDPRLCCCLRSPCATSRSSRCGLRSRGGGIRSFSTLPSLSACGFRFIKNHVCQIGGGCDGCEGCGLGR